MLILDIVRLENKEVRKYEGSEQYFTEVVYQINYKSSARGRKIFKEEIRFQLVASSKAWNQKNNQSVADNMTKDWKVSLSNSTFINQKFGWISLEGLGVNGEFDTEREALVLFEALLEKDFDTKVVQKKIQAGLEACRERVLAYDRLYR